MVGVMNWNQKDDTIRCLESLKSVLWPALKIVLLDNGSVDDSVQVISKRFPDVVILKNEKNRGCAGGRNDLLRYFLQTELKYIMFLDNDAIVEKDTIKILTEEISKVPGLGVIGIKAYYADRPNMFWSKGGDRFDCINGGFHDMGQGQIDEGQYEKMEEVDSVPGGFTFFTRAVAERVSCLDERYFIYFEDSDWCFRVKKAGFKLMTSKAAKVYHRVSASLGMESALFYYYRTRNCLLFMKEHGKRCFIRFFLAYLLLKSPALIYMLLRSRKYKQACGVMLGFWDALLGRWHECKHKVLF
ncbi:MAG: hypothetical protein A2036_01335 [Omnitrophica bacterium GWA2_50_21]|nr:MAG: hypothetical protein A2036_01335 [Omnitrophica bacterium GWA2_50_21]